MGPKILVVDDEAGLVGSLTEGLLAEGFTVETAGDGVHGLALATRGGFDAIVLDVMLPGIGGEEICRELRRLGDSTPILMLTARRGAEVEAGLLDSGADDFLAKPFSFVVLVARLRALFRRGERNGEARMVAAGGLTLDPDAHLVYRQGCRIPLTPTETAVLGFLMRHSGQVISRRQLLDHVWDLAFDGEPNIVDVYVSALRRKIDTPFDASSIQTIRGVGYRLVVDP